MSTGIVASIIAATTSGIVALLLSWLGEAVSSARHQRRLERLDLCIRLRGEIGTDNVATSVVETEIANVVSALESSQRRRPKWRSAIGYIFGVFLTYIPLAVAYYAVYPGVRANPAMLLFMMLPPAIVYAIESQPLFLQPIVGRWARDRSRPTKKESSEGR